MGWRESMRHAFAVDDPDAFTPNDVQRELVDGLAQRIARRGMTTPVSLMLDVGQPYNYLTSQTMHFFRPVASTLLWTFAPFLPRGLSPESYAEFARMLEHRGALPYIRQRVEHFEEMYETSDQSPKDDDMTKDDAMNVSEDERTTRPCDGDSG
ncbi:MAG: hypothetical protein EA377_13205 [Phycisphaerales bacterium]|nr:MAG: hypothetical protein EA377_13205 [Phycisphaerales bacterium]